MSADDTEVYVYRKRAIIQIVWCRYQEHYHWYVFVDGKDRGDSLKQIGMELDEVALTQAKRHADWILDDCE